MELRLLPGLGDVRFRALLESHGSGEAVLALPASKLGEAAAAARGSGRIRARVRHALETLARAEVSVLTVHRGYYPARLREVRDHPCLLFAVGRLELLERLVLAVIGARSATYYGLSAARMLARELAAAGVVVASGLARGIDAAAHEGSFPDTIAVLGCGIDVPYPYENARLQEGIAREGLLLSEFVPGEPALGRNFPRRNRVIAGIARGVLVVEARKKSGTLITVEHASDIGLDIFAVPGPIGRPTSAGTNALIRDGAALVTGVEDILRELDLPAPPSTDGRRRKDRTGPPPKGLDSSQAALWHILDDEARHVDELASRAGLSPAAALAALLQLEIGDHVRQLPGLQFVAARAL